MGNSQNLAAGPFFVFRERCPQILRVLAIVLRERTGLVRPHRAVTEQNVAVQVVGALGCVLVAYDRREHTGFVVAVRQRRVFLPGMFDRLRIVDRRLVVRQRRHDLHRGVERKFRITRGQSFVPGLTLLR